MSYYNGPITITNGLVMYLDGENQKSYVSGSTTWSDLSANGNATMVNTPTYSQSRPGSFSFNGATGTYFTAMGNTALKSITGDVTLCAWCRQDNRYVSNTPHQTVIATNSSYRGGLKLMSDYWGGGVSAWLANGNGTADYMLQSSSITGLGWKYICATRNSASGLLALYIDGTLASSVVTFTGSTNNYQDPTIGAEYHSAGLYYYYGRISSAQAYNRVLSSDEILQNYNATKGKFENFNYLTSNLVFFLDSGTGSSYIGSGSTWTDRGSGANNGTLTNGPTFGGDGGGSVVLDGVDDSVILGSNITLGNGDWTVNILVKATSFASDNYGNIFSNNSGGPVTNAMGITNTGKMVYNNYDGNWQSRYGNTTLSIGRWYYLTWVNKSDNTITMYVNGVADSTPANSYTTNGGPVNSIGKNWYSYFSGRIASVSYYNVAHTSAQVAENFKWARSRAAI